MWAVNYQLVATDQFDASEASHAKRRDNFDVFQSNCTELVVVSIDWRRRQWTRPETTAAHAWLNINELVKCQSHEGVTHVQQTDWRVCFDCSTLLHPMSYSYCPCEIRSAVSSAPCSEKRHIFPTSSVGAKSVPILILARYWWNKCVTK